MNNRLIIVVAAVFLVSSKLYCPVRLCSPKRESSSQPIRESSSQPILVQEHHIESHHKASSQQSNIFIGKTPQFKFKEERSVKIEPSEIGKMHRHEYKNRVAYSKYINERGWQVWAEYYPEGSHYRAKYYPEGYRAYDQSPEGMTIELPSSESRGRFNDLEKEWKKQNQKTEEDTE